MKETSNRERQTNLIFGIRPIIEAVESGKDIDKILIQKGSRGDLLRELQTVARKKDIPLRQVPVEKLNRLTRKNHQGAVAYIAQVSFHELKELLPTIDPETKPILLMLDRITDVRNFGAIARTAECAGVSAIIIGRQGSAPASADAVKTSAGALMRIPVCREHNLKTSLQYLKEQGYQAVACTEKTEDSMYAPDYSRPTVIIMGSEEDGISDPLLKRADHLAAIPMLGSIGSLNVSVASGIILYEAIRQRKS